MNLKDNLGTLIPLGSAFIIFISALKNMVYYTAFNIAIFRYINFSDLFLMILFDIILLVIFLVFLIIFPLALEEDRPPRHELSSIKKPRTPVFVWLGLFVVMFISLSTYGRDFSSATIAWVLLSFFILSFFIFLYIVNRVQKRVRNLFTTLFIVFSVIILMFTIAFKDINQTKTNNNYQYKLVLEEETIETNQNLIYVGKTLDYVFLYDLKKDMARIIETKLLKEMRVTYIDRD